MKSLIVKAVLLVQDLAVSEPRKVLDEKGYEGKTVVFGIRPEDIHSEQIALDASPETVVETTITVAELTV